MRSINYYNQLLAKYCLECLESYSEIEHMPEKGEHTQIYSL